MKKPSAEKIKSLATAGSSKSSYSGLSARARFLLSKDEGSHVDFKAGMAGIKSDDIVAFANSVDGGAILIGVEEYTNERGEQRGRIIGCPISDENKLSINNKSLQCVPPVSVSIHIENSADVPFFRIEIQSSINKPHCTSGGTYKIRKDNLNVALGPIELLQVFLESEGTGFIERFKQATTELRTEISSQNQELIDYVESSTADLEINTRRIVENLGFEMEAIIDDVKQQTGSLESQMDDFVNTLQQETTDIKEQLEFGDLRRVLNDIEYKLTRNSWKSNKILEHLGLEDPEIEYERKRFKGMLSVSKKVFGKRKIKVDDTYLQDLFNHSSQILQANYTIEDVKSWYEEVDESDED
ncbi:AlbA family DNA-binding domain-containing protein [Hymenobacter terricola]|uniref:AlbA family DNA-binding domain-containing protein n=1 Tax=Hymenobacter terricola TaxID=2819236 RepID=UPI001B30D0FF|nr:ATP-binding protein [Hymenobacter terricola]